MIELDLTDEQQAVRGMARALAADLVDAAAGRAEHDADVPPAVRAALESSGLTAPVPERLGGGGPPDGLTQLVAAEELAAGDPGIAAAAFWAGAADLLLTVCGTPAQQDAWFVPGSRHGSDAVALYEGFGRSPAEYTTTLRHGIGGCSVVGSKVAVPFADRRSRLVLVGNDADGLLRAAIVAGDADGVTISSPSDGRPLALGAARLRSVAFDTEVDDGHLIGGENLDAAILRAAVVRLRLLPAAVAIGAARRAVEYAADYANERMAFGRAISSFQGVSFLLAEASIRIAAARLELWDVAARVDGEVPVADAAVGQAVNYACTVASESTRDALQVLGGHGFITDHPVERWYRTTAALSTLDSDPVCTAFAPAL